MSVETLIGRNTTQILEAQSYIKDRTRKEKQLGYTRSPVYIVASTFINEGRKELKEISGKLNSSGIRINPVSTISIFRQIPSPERKKAGLAYAVVSFGVVMISIEQLMKDKLFIPSDMTSLFNYAVGGTFIPRWNANGLGAIPISKPNYLRLGELAHKDPTLSIMLTKGLNYMPEQLKRVIDNVGLAPIATKILIPSYGELVRKVIRETKRQ